MSGGNPRPEDAPPERPGWLGPAALTFVAAALRLPGLGEAPLWPDEAATWWYAGRIADGGLLESMRLEPTPPLYYGLVGAWTGLAGDGTFALRLPSAVAGIAAVPVVHRVGRDLLGSRAAPVAAALTAVHPLLVASSREARVYPILVLLVVLALGALHRAIATGSTRAVGLLAVVLAAAGWSHPYGVFLLGTCAVLTLATARETARWRILAAVGGAAIVVAPWWLATLPHLRESGAAWSVEEMYRMLPGEARLGRALEISFVGAAYNPFLRVLDRPPTPAALRWPSLLVHLGLLAAVAGLARRRPERRLALALMAGAWLGLVLVPWAITRAGPPIYHLGRHDLYALGPVVLLLAAGWTEVLRRRRVVAVLAASVLLGAASHRLVGLHRAPVDPRDRQVGEHLAAAQGQGDVVVAFGIRRLKSEHPARRAGATLPFRSFPPETDAHPGWSDDRTLVRRLPELREEAEVLAGELERRDGLVFLLVRKAPPSEDETPSLAWLVDGQLLSVLEASGWRRDPSASAPDLGILAVRPPEGDGDGPESRREPREDGSSADD